MATQKTVSGPYFRSCSKTTNEKVTALEDIRDPPGYFHFVSYILFQNNAMIRPPPEKTKDKTTDHCSKSID